VSESVETDESGFDFALEYTSSPDHILLDPVARQVVRVALSELPVAIRSWLRRRAPVLFVVPLAGPAFTRRFRNGLSANVELLVLREAIFSDRPRDQAAAVVAHEIGHIYLRDHGGESPDRLQRELDADRCAADWGFDGLIANHETELALATTDELRAELGKRIEVLRERNVVKPTVNEDLSEG
jgi:hypothetical protein